MAWQYHPVLLLFFLGGLVALGVAVFCYQYMRRHGFSYLVGGIGLFGLHNAIWAFAAALKTASTDLEMKLLFYKLEFLGSGVTPSIALVIALSLVGWDRWLTRKTLAVLVAVPVVVVTLIITNPHQVMITDPVTVQAQGIRAFEHSFPPLFVLFLAMGLGAATLASIIIAYEAVKRTIPWQTALVGVLVFMLPVIVISMKVGGIYPPDGKGINITPAVNAFALSLLAVAIIRYRIFELLPIGRDHAVEVMQDGYVLVGPDETVLDANPAAVELLTGESGSSLIQESVDEIVPVYDELDKPDGPDRAVFSIDERTIEVRRSAMRRQHQTAGCLLLFQDISEKQARERELKRTIERLDQFASVLSHDLRNPLNVAQGRLELAREETDNEHLASVSNAIDRMEALIDEVLTYSRQSEPISESEQVSLALIVNRCWEVVASRDATLTVEGDVTFMADATRIQQLFENLFRNAIEHGGDDVTVRVGALVDGDGFYVADDGPGIPKGDRSTVFESGYSTDKAGTGFGLAIVTEIANAHGWSIQVTDSADGGARFEITGVEFPD